MPTTPTSVTSLPGFLNGVSAASASSVWAVGFVAGSGTQDMMILHWNGHRWAQLHRANPPGSTGALLNGVSAASASDAWAVGDLYTPGGDESLVLRWNGTNWKRKAAPGTGLQAVSADSARDAWAISTNAVLHWNGSRWTQVTIPTLTAEDALTAVSASSASNVWIVGSTNLNNTSGEVVPLALHWNGAKWRRVTTLAPTSGAALAAVSIRSSHGWAVGDYGPTVTFALRWNGHDWKRIHTPSPGENGCSLLGVSTLSASDAWAVGAFNSGGNEYAAALRWNGSRWRQVATPTPSGGAQLSSVSVVSRSDAWAVGYSGIGITLIEHWNGRRWTQF
jgi:hypothetical protein